MCYKAHVLSLIVVLITTVSVTSSRYLQANEGGNMHFASETRKGTGEMFGQSLLDNDFIRPVYDATNRFPRQHDDSSNQYSSEIYDNSNFVSARMIPYDFSQEPEEPYVYEVTSEKSKSTTLEGTLSTQRSRKPVSTHTPVTISTDDPQTSTSAPSLPVTTVSFTTHLMNETQTTLFTTESQTVTLLPSTTMTSFSTVQHLMNTTVSSEKPTTTSTTSQSHDVSSAMKTTPSAITATSHEAKPSTTNSAYTTITSYTTNSKLEPSVNSSTLLIRTSTRTPNTVL